MNIHHTKESKMGLFCYSYLMVSGGQWTVAENNTSKTEKQEKSRENWISHCNLRWTFVPVRTRPLLEEINLGFTVIYRSVNVCMLSASQWYAAIKQACKWEVALGVTIIKNNLFPLTIAFQYLSLETYNTFSEINNEF